MHIYIIKYILKKIMNIMKWYFQWITIILTIILRIYIPDHKEIKLKPNEYIYADNSIELHKGNYEIKSLS